MTDLALILISAGLITLIFKWLKQPLVLGYIVAGILAGPYIDFLPTVSDSESIGTWSEIGVVFLLFALGLEFSFRKLINVGSTAFITATTEVISMLIIGFGVGMLLGWSFVDSIFLGGMLSMSSTTIIIKAFDDLGMRNNKETTIVFGTLVVEDLVAILMMVLLPAIAVSKQFAGGPMLESLLRVFFFLVLWFLIGIFILPAFFKKAKKIMNDETLLIISLGLCLGMVVLATHTGFSAALGAFIMGSILAETIEAEHIEHITKPVKDLFGAIFFVSVGMMVDPAILVEYAIPVIVITVVTLIGKAFFSSFGVLLSGQTLKTSIKAGFSLAQIGEFAFIIAALGVSLGVLENFVYPIIIAVSVITTFTTPYFIKMAFPFSEWLYKALPDRTRNFLNRYASGSKTINHESDWKKLLKRYAGRMIIYVVLLTAVFMFSSQMIVPFVDERFLHWGIWGRVLSATVTFLLMSPFLIALASNRTNCPDLFMSLWNDSKYNRGHLVSLTLLRIFIAMVFVALVLIHNFNLQYGGVLVVTLAIFGLIFIFRRDLNQYSKLEKRFLTNLNQREEAERKRYPLKTSFASELKEKDINLITVIVPPTSCFIGKSLAELAFRNEFGVSVVKITRGERVINIPDGSERLYPQDRIVVVGTDGQLTLFQQRLDEQLPQETGSPNPITLLSFTVEEGSVLAGKDMREAGIGQKYNCVIVGVERDDASLMNPDNSVIFEAGDLVWVVGEVNKISELMGS